MVSAAQSPFVSGLQYFGKAMPLYPQDSAAEMLPFPRRNGGVTEVVVLFYLEAGPRGQRVIRPPVYAVFFSPDATVLRHGPCAPPAVGIAAPHAQVPDYGRPSSMEIARAAQERLFELAPRVWSAWQNDDRGADAQLAAKEYWHSHLAVCLPHEAPWYEQAGADFFRWLRHLVGARRPP